MKICLVCSHGGHLSEMLHLINAFDEKEVALVTYDEVFTRRLQNNTISHKYLIEDLTLRFSKYKNTPISGPIILLTHMFITCLRELKIFLKEHPNVVISTGSEIAIPMLFFARIFGRKCVFIESLCRVEGLSGTGKLVYPICDVFLVQWPLLSRGYRRAIYAGSILDSMAQSAIDKESFVFVTVGTSPFPRLIREMDEIAGKLTKKVKVVMQIGNTNYLPKNAEYFRFHPSYQVIKKLNDKAKVVVCHAGIGSIMSALEAGAFVIAVPRLKKYKEHRDNHQLQIVKALAKKGTIEPVYDINRLEIILRQKLGQKIRTIYQSNNEQSNKLVKFLRESMDSWGN